MAKDAKGHGSNARGGANPASSLHADPSKSFFHPDNVRARAQAFVANNLAASHQTGVNSVGGANGFKDKFGNQLKVGDQVHSSESAAGGRYEISSLYNEGSNGRPLASVTATFDSGSKVTRTAYPEDLHKLPLQNK